KHAVAPATLDPDPISNCASSFSQQSHRPDRRCEEVSATRGDDPRARRDENLCGTRPIGAFGADIPSAVKGEADEKVVTSIGGDFELIHPMRVQLLELLGNVSLVGQEQ